MELTASEKSLLYNGLLALIDNNKLVYDHETITLNESDDLFLTEHLTLYNEIKLAKQLRTKLSAWKDNKINQVKPLYLSMFQPDKPDRVFSNTHDLNGNYINPKYRDLGKVEEFIQKNKELNKKC